LAQHLRAEPAAVLLDVPLVVELLRGEVARLGTELASLGQRVGDLKVAERHHLRAERVEMAARSGLIPSGMITSMR
jgi:hypothetical protein